MQAWDFKYRTHIAQSTLEISTKIDSKNVKLFKFLKVKKKKSKGGKGFPGGSEVKNPPANTGDMG